MRSSLVLMKGTDSPNDLVDVNRVHMFQALKWLLNSLPTNPAGGGILLHNLGILLAAGGRQGMARRFEGMA